MKIGFYNADKLNKIRSLTLPELAKKCKKFEQQERDRKRQAHVYKQYLQTQADTEYKTEVKIINEKFVKKISEFKEKALRDLENEQMEINKALEINQNNVEDSNAEVVKEETSEKTSKNPKKEISQDQSTDNTTKNPKPSKVLSSPKKQNQEETTPTTQTTFGAIEFFEYMDMPAQRKLRNREKLPPGAYTGEMISDSHQKPKSKQNNDDEDDSDDENGKLEISKQNSNNDKIAPQNSNEEKGKRNVGPTAVLASDGSAMYLQGQEKVETKISKAEINQDLKLLGL